MVVLSFRFFLVKGHHVPPSHVHGSRILSRSLFCVDQNSEVSRVIPRSKKSIFTQNSRNVIRALDGSDAVLSKESQDPFVSQSSQLYTRLSPAGIVHLPPRVEHIILERRGLAADIISSMLQLPNKYVEDLIRFGAVYYSPIPPRPPPHAGSHIHAAYEALPQSPLLAMKRKRTKGEMKDNSVASGPIVRIPTLGEKPVRLTNLNQILEAGGFVRVHVNPKRFSRCYEVDWETLILADTPDYIVINKPLGIPVGGTVDNQVESCTFFAARALGLPEKLFPAHQLDTCTQGCVVLAKTKSFASHFNSLLRERKVKKIYRALTTSPMEMGPLIHYMRPGKYAPRIVENEGQEGWQYCELEILEGRQVALPHRSVFQKEGVEMVTFPASSGSTFEYCIQLHTGRTHQLRAQFAACGAPLVGDTMYIPQAMAQNLSSKLRLKESWPSPEPPSSLVVDETSQVRGNGMANLEEVEGIVCREGATEKEMPLSEMFVDALALQAWKISWEGGPAEIEAPDPWWRT